MSVIHRSAVFSRCGNYRYQLERLWDGNKPMALIAGLNPSTASASEEDPTSTKCIGFAQRWGCGGYILVNTQAAIATHPRELFTMADSVGPDNYEYVDDAATRCSVFVAAWGASKYLSAKRRDAFLYVLSNHGVDLYCLGTNKDGSPRHPLYLSYETSLTLWLPAASRGSGGANG